MADTGLATIITDTINAARRQRERASAGVQDILGTLQTPTDIPFSMPPAASIGNTAIPSAMAAIASAISGNKLYQQANIAERGQETSARMAAESEKNRITAQDLITRRTQTTQIQLALLDKQFESAIHLEDYAQALDLADRRAKLEKQLADLHEQGATARSNAEIAGRIKEAQISADRYIEAAKISAGIKGPKFDTLEGIAAASKQLTMMAGDAAQAFQNMQNKNKNLKAKEFWNSDIGKQFKSAKALMIGAMPVGPVQGEGAQQWVDRRQQMEKPVEAAELKKYFPDEPIVGGAPTTTTPVKQGQRPLGGIFAKPTMLPSHTDYLSAYPPAQQQLIRSILGQ